MTLPDLNLGVVVHESKERLQEHDHTGRREDDVQRARHDEEPPVRCAKRRLIPNEAMQETKNRNQHTNAAVEQPQKVLLHIEQANTTSSLSIW
jgi:hypothetical protein